MKKTISGLLALILLASVCAGCGGPAGQEPEAGGPSGLYYEITGIDPAETVLEADGVPVSAELYFYWLAYACSTMEYQLNMYYSAYGLYSEMFGEDGAILWDQELEPGLTFSQQALENAESNALFYASIESMADDCGVTLTGEDQTQLEELRAGLVEEYGGEEAFQDYLYRMGISEESFNRISNASYLFAHLQELAQDPASDLYEAPSDDNAYVDHILLMTVDSATGEDLSDEEKAGKRARAEELLAQLQAADAADLEALFTRLADENGEDQGRTAETGYLINPETNFVQEFKDAAFSLAPGQISGIVESSYGYHILLRKALTEAQTATLAGDHVAALLEERSAAAEVTRSEKLDAVNAGSFYNDLTARLEALDAADGGDGGDGAAE